jgi:hypothetical protein
MVDFQRHTIHFPVFIICGGGELKPEHVVWTDVDGFHCLAVYTDPDHARRCAQANGGKMVSFRTAADLAEALENLRDFDYVAFDPDLDERTSYTPMLEFIEGLRGHDG